MDKSKWFIGLLTGAALIWMAGITTPDCAGSGSTVRFRMKDGRRMPVPVNGRAPYDFLPDTGTAISMIDQKITRDLGLRARIGIRLGTFTGAAHVPVARVETLSVGPETLRDLNVISCDLRNLCLFDNEIRGVLGQDFLSKTDYLTSCRKRTLRFKENRDLKCLLRGERLESERYPSPP
jgi:Aspartyl protease